MDGAGVNGSQSSKVERLGPHTLGRWRVVTERAVHLWDLDRMAYVRIPGLDSEAFGWDGSPQAIVDVRKWPVVEETFCIYVSPPENPLAGQWRISSRIHRIEPDH